jgi:ATP-dependent DNA ligase
MTAAASLPVGTVIEGEIIAPSNRPTDVPAALASGGTLDLRVFAVPHYGREDARGHTLDWAEQTMARHGLAFLPFRPWRGETADELRADAKSQGIEGYVLKAGHCKGWYKVKAARTADCTVIGVKAGTGRNAGKCGSLLLSVRGVPFSCAGFDDATRDAITHRDMGRLCEVEFQELTRAGKPINPRFIRWRPDKKRRAESVD